MDITIDSSGERQVIGMLSNLKASMPNIVTGIALKAAGITTDAARPTVPRDTGDSARSLRHYLTNSGGAVAEGGATVMHYRWLELGGASGRNHANKRPIITQGRYIHPAYLRNESKIQNMQQTEFSKGVQAAGMEVS